MTSPTRFEIRKGLERTRKILSMRHRDKMTLEAIGKHFGLTKERVYQIIHRKSFITKANEKTFPRRIRIMWEGQLKTLLTRY